LHNKTIDRLKKKLDQQIQGSGMEMEEPIHNDFDKKAWKRVSSWSQQLKAASAKSRLASSDN